MKIPAEVQFAQRLAANEKTDRDKAVRKLKRWFHSRSAGKVPFTEEELLRIWKGLFYCYWMSDKPLVQEELAMSLASMIDNFANEEAALLFINTFLQTMGREWFGIDRWRMDKFMMMVRRFIRQIFKFNKKHDWRPELTENISKTFADNLFLCDISKTSLGLQMHIADVFLEELAKVGGEELDATVIDTYLDPFYKVVSQCREIRLREHIAERIFNYLLRQSDCGIEWEVEKDVEALGNIEVVQNGEEEDQEQEENDGEEKNEENYAEMEGEEEEILGEDPRAGSVNVEIPQLQVDYTKISEKLFSLGSETSTMKSNRSILYKLSQHFKDVGNNVFPLGDTVFHDEEVDKVSVKREVAKLQKREENIEKKKAKSKKEYKEWKKEQARLEKQAAEQNGDLETEQNEDLENFEEDFNDDEVDNTENLKRKFDDEAEDDSPDAKKAKVEENKMRKKELEKKRKREQKRRKRERLLAQKLEESEQRRKADNMIERDLEMKALVSIDQEKKKEKNDLVESTTVNGNTEEVKIDNVEKKKKKKKKSKEPSAENSEEPVVIEKKNEKDKESTKKNKGELLEPEKSTVNDEESSPKKKKKNKKNKKSSDEVENNQEQLQSSLPVENGVSEDSNEHASSPKKKKDKKKKSKEDTENSTDSTPKKKAVAQESEEKTNENVKPASPKKKKSFSTEENTSGGKLFAEPTDWDIPLQPGEQEIVIPNKKYKGKQKLKPAAENDSGVEVETKNSNGFQDFPSPTLSTPKVSHTAMFLKKAMSKSATPKKKLSQVEKLKAKGTSSESRIKRVNFALTKNTMQAIEDLNASIKSSPGIPHDPRKHPEKSLLKRNAAGEREGSPMLNPVALNTQLNSISKKGKKLLGKKNRMSAMDFF